MNSASDSDEPVPPEHPHTDDSLMINLNIDQASIDASGGDITQTDAYRSLLALLQKVFEGDVDDVSKLVSVAQEDQVQGYDIVQQISKNAPFVSPSGLIN